MVSAVTWADPYEQFISVSLDGTMKIWDMANHSLLFQHSFGRARCWSIVRMGSQFAVGHDKGLILFDIVPEN